MLDERIEEAVRTLENPDITEFRTEGGRAIGFFCSYVPEELLNVDGLASFRMRSIGCHSTGRLRQECERTHFVQQAQLPGQPFLSQHIV